MPNEIYLKITLFGWDQKNYLEGLKRIRKVERYLGSIMSKNIKN